MNQSLVQILIVFLVLAALVFLDLSSLLKPILDFGRVGVDFLLTPLVQVFGKAREFLYLAGQLKDLASENQLLGKQVEKLTADLAMSEKAKDENRILREALGLQEESKRQLVAAEVIAVDSPNAVQKMTLNRGKKQGVAEGQAVVAPSGVLVGAITQAFGNTSQMDILTSSASVINAEVVPGGASGIVRGDHGLGLLFDLVSQNEVVKPGDKILTSGLGGQFPKGLLIGEIGKISSGESELFQKANVLPVTNLRTLRLVLVIVQQ